MENDRVELAFNSRMTEIYRGSNLDVMSQSIPTGYIPLPGQPLGISSKNLPGGSGFDF